VRSSVPHSSQIHSTPYTDCPAELPALEECAFYHSIELPGVGLQVGQWDLRPGIGSYLGPTDFGGLRVLEIGPANGFVSFELERRGAEVVAVDLPAPTTYDTRPGATDRFDLGAMEMEVGLQRIRNAFWLGHALFSSSARVVYAHVNDIPDSIGRFDVVVLANVLQHCREPITAVLNAARFADSVVVTETDWMVGSHDYLCGMILFEGAGPFSWFQVKPRLLASLLEELGLTDQELTHHEQLLVEDIDFSASDPQRREWGGLAVPHFTLTAHRSRST
jgi:SAM-dependent methyltransferase